MADTIAVLNKGKVEQMGAPVELYENPRTAFVAGFLGQTNLLSVNVLEPGRRRHQGRLPRRHAAAAGQADGRHRHRGRGRRAPGEAPDRRPRPGAGQHERIDGTIIDASFIGVSTQYLVRSLADAEEELTVFSQNSATELRRVGEQVSLLLAPRAHLRPARGRVEGSRSGRGRLMISVRARGGDQMSVVAAAQHVPGTAAPPPAEPVGSKKLTPYFLLLPMALVLVVFFVLPILTLLNSSLTTGGLEEGYTFTFAFSNYWEVWTEYWPQFLRSFVYAATRHRAGHRDRLSARLHDRLQGERQDAADHAGADHRAVLHQLPDPDAGLDHDPGRRRPGGQLLRSDRAAVASPIWSDSPATAGCWPRRSR